MKNYLFLLFIVLSLGACNNPDEKSNTHVYFDFQGLFKNQVTALVKSKAKALKTSQFNDSKSTKPELVAVNWEKDLELFMQLDLNKPAYKMSYDSTFEANSTLYTLKPEENLPIKFVRLQKKEGITTISAKMQVDNFLYHSEKTLVANLANGLLTDYEVEGFQEIIFLPKSYYKIKTWVK